MSSDRKLYWYLPWLAQQVATLPPNIVSLLAEEGETSLDLSPESALHKAFMFIRQATSDDNIASIEEIVDYLHEQSDIMAKVTNLSAKHLLVFAILGWQSMLYLPSFNTCSLDEFAVHQAPDQPNSGLIFDTFKISATLADRPMSILLKAYGNLLPARFELTRVASETSRVASSWLSINPFEVNAYMLQTLLRIDIRWVDTLSLHLDYDKSTRTLSLFRYPSFCAQMLQEKGTIYFFASTEPMLRADRRANQSEISDFLSETLLSYRLLFGQYKPSRALFRRMISTQPILSIGPDPLLARLCARRLFLHPHIPLDRQIYFATRDFPVLGERIELLAREMKGAKPGSWKDLVRDRRDTTQYWTFWLVAIFGSASLLLSFIQVVLQGYSISQ